MTSDRATILLALVDASKALSAAHAAVFVTMTKVAGDVPAREETCS